MNQIDSLVKEINKKMGEGTIARASQHKGVRMVRSETGILSLDIALGGGLVKNSLAVFYGKSKSGKSTLCAHTIAEHQRKGEQCAYIYSEGPLDDNHLATCGVNLNDLLLTISNNSENVVDIVETLASSKMVSLIVVDSLQGLVPDMVLERSASERTRGVEAFMNNLLIRKFIAATTCKAHIDPWCSLAIVSQGRPNEDGWIEPTGGEGQKFFSVQMIEVAAGKFLSADGAEIDDLSKRVGYKLSFKIRKNKTFPPHKSGSINYYTASTNFGLSRGNIDHILDMVTCGVQYGFFEQKGAWIVDNQGNKYNGKNEFRNFLSKMSKEELVVLKNNILKKALEIESNILVDKSPEFENIVDKALTIECTPQV